MATPKNKRKWSHDYSAPCIYMVTMTVAGRRRILASLSGTAASPCMVLSPLGMRVNDCILSIPVHYPEIQVWNHVVMEDHVHILLRVTRSMAGVLLGDVIKGFKAGCNKALRELDGGDSGRLPLFENGFHDRILSRAGQLNAMKRYIADNPRRLAIKRMNPQLFTKYLHVTIGDQDYAAYGNIFLLRDIDRQQVQVHRSDSDTEHRLHMEAWLECVLNGGVLVSPFISEREKEAREMARENSGKMIILKENGFPDVFTPQGWEFDYCARGLLLLLAPWPHHNDRRTITREQCLSLNEMAAAVCRLDGEAARLVK